jgi:hypothetical protein
VASPQVVRAILPDRCTLNALPVFSRVKQLAVSSSMFLLGSKVVAFTAAGPALLAEIASLLPVAGESNNAGTVKIIDKPFDNLELALIAISECLLAEYQGNLWLDAAVLVAPNGSTVMLCGASEAGKSTLTTAFCQSKWKVVTEDVAIVFPDGTIPPLIRPISLCPGTAERIQQQTQLIVEALNDRWFFNPSAFLDTRLQMPLSRVILIKGVNPEHPDMLSFAPISVEQMLRELLPCSNALRIADGIEFLLQCLKDSPCWLIEGGSIRERMEAIENLTGN